MKKICENCAYSREYAMYKGCGCPYLLCKKEGQVQVTRWQSCDEWEGKPEHDGRTKETDS